MSGLAIGRGRTVGLTAAAAVLLSATSSGAAVAAATEDPAQLTILKNSLNLETVQAPRSGPISADAAERTAAAQADPTLIPSVCSVSGFAPTKVVLGATPAKVKFSVTVDNCTLDKWAVLATRFLSDDPESLDGVAGNLEFEEANGTVVRLSPTMVMSPKVITNADAGKQPDGAIVMASGQEDPPDTETAEVEPATAVLPLTVLRRSTFGSTFRAGPEPVKKGKAITLKATLGRVNWNGAKTLKYIGFPKAKVQVQFKASGASKFVTVKTVIAGKGGKVATKVKANQTGRWRFVFAGVSTTAGATSASDGVAVN
jgi:hypothetical protein